MRQRRAEDLYVSRCDGAAPPGKWCSSGGGGRGGDGAAAKGGNDLFLFTFLWLRLGSSPDFVVLPVVAVHRQTPKSNSNSCCTAAAPLHHCTTIAPPLCRLSCY